MSERWIFLLNRNESGSLTARSSESEVPSLKPEAVSNQLFAFTKPPRKNVDVSGKGSIAQENLARLKHFKIFGVIGYQFGMI